MELYQRNVQIRHCNFIYHKFWKFPLWGIVLVFLPNNWSQTRFTEKPSLATNWNVESIHKGLMWGWGLVLRPISDPIEYSSILQFESPIVGIRLLIVVLVLFWLCFLLIPAFCPPLNSIKAPKVAVAFPPLNLIIVTSVWNCWPFIFICFIWIQSGGSWSLQGNGIILLCFSWNLDKVYILFDMSF